MNAFLKLMLKGSAASVFALTMAAVGCSDSDKDNETGAGGEDGGGKGGTPSAAGSSNGGDSTGKGGEGGAGATTQVGGADAGGADAGGADAGGADAGGASAGGAGGADAGGSAVAKFCNDLTFGTAQDPMDTTFILEIGEGASKVSFTATTGACAPAACSALPVGTDIPYALFDADAPETEIDGGTLDILDGEVLAFYTDLSDDTEPVPVAKALTFDISAAECKDITYTDVYE